MEKDIPCKWNSKEAGAAVVISDKTDFKTKSLTQDKEGQPVDVWQNQYNIVK